MDIPICGLIRFMHFVIESFRDEAHQIGLDPNFKQISETESFYF